jgi:heme-degrading monooxygenase HmoA
MNSRSVVSTPAEEAWMQKLHQPLPSAHRFSMIARIWHGRTPADQGDAYLAFLIERAVPDYKAVPGNLSVRILRRNDDGVSHFLIITEWESREAIESFAGADIEVAKYYPEDKDFLLDFEPTVTHYDLHSY